MTRGMPFAALLLAALVAGEAAAHATSTSFLELRSMEPMQVRWDIAVADLAFVVPLDADGDGAVTWSEVQAAKPLIDDFVARRLTIERGRVACSREASRLGLIEHLGEMALAIEARMSCPSGGAWQIAADSTVFGDVTHRVLASLHGGNGMQLASLSPANPQWSPTSNGGAWRSFVSFVGQGIWHVLIGLDHIAFIALLLLPSMGAGSLRAVVRDLLTIVTTFTVAHSITLGLATAGLLAPPAWLIEPAIALSIVLAAGLNLAPGFARYRLPLAFGFGLVHGFGFSFALAALGSFGTDLLPMLAGFNIGVELAQLALVAAALPLLLWLRRDPMLAARAGLATSLGLAAIGAYWFIDRVAA